MPFYEVVYETGEHSVAQYDSDEEAQSAIKAQHERAVSGQPGGPDGTQWPAIRIKRVLVYDYHPADFGSGQEVPTDTLLEAVNSAVKDNEKDGTVQVHVVAAAVRDLSSPVVPDRSTPFDSSYKAPEARELEVTWQ